MKYEEDAPWRTRRLIETLTMRFGRLDARLEAVEIGVEKGCTSEVLLRYMPNLRLTLVDSWCEGDGTSDWRQLEHDDNLIETLNRIRPYRNRTKVIWRDSVLAAHQINEASLDFIFFDGDHSYEGTSRDLLAWYGKIKPGGLATGDDYGGRMEKRGFWGVKRAVDEFAVCRGLRVHSRPLNFFFFEKPL